MMRKLSEEECLESITLELRPRLRSCIVFIHINNNDPSSIGVKLTETNITIIIKRTFRNLLLTPVKLIPTSISSLRITNRWISFRVQTKPETIFGTFKTEIMNDLTSSMKNGTTVDLNLPSPGSSCSLRCKCCENLISNSIICKRVFPLPDKDLNSEDFFCCRNSSKIDFKLITKPRETDYFYGPSFCLMHNNVMRNVDKKKNTILCKRCLTILGVKEDSGSIKIWNCCVEQRVGDEEFKDISHSPINEFISIFKECSDILGEEILIEALEGSSIHYILMKPMEWQLDILTEKSTKCEGKTIELQKSRVIKVFYIYGEKNESVRKDFVHSKYYLVALPLMLAGIEHLVASTKRLPPAYRTVTQYFIGYINTQSDFFDDIP